MFSKSPALGIRLLILAALSVGVMVTDARFDYLKPVRSELALVLSPLYEVAGFPLRAWEGVSDQFSSRTELMAENERLKAEQLLLQRRLQKLAALTEQNVRLRELLNSAALVDDKVLVGELIGVDPNPYTHRIIIDKGAKDGVFVGQPVLDASGLMGQVVEVMPYSARVLLLTDVTHSIPVQVNRNGLRAIAVGTGNPERLELRYVADTADIKEGDLLVSSGLGQRFPAGYPVATVSKVIHDSGQPFAVVRAIPTAKLNRSRYMLLVFSDTRTPEQRANDAAEAQEAADRHAAQRPAAPANPPPAGASAAQPAAANVTPAPAAGTGSRSATPAKPPAGQGSSPVHSATPTKPPANASGNAAHPAAPAKPPVQGATATPSHPAANATQPQRRVQQPAPELPDEGDR
ncbi:MULTISPECIES: rod shape-determining protein MreC [unclassified Pseudomonas]|nr:MULTISPECIES: rod shape-determining protein MreC [unclassified Pseudomonas]